MSYDTLIVDFPYLSHRSYCAPFQLTTKTGLNSTLIYSFLVTVKSLREKFNPKEIIFACESYGTKSWRRALQSTYKPVKRTEQGYITSVNDLKILLYLLGYKQCKADCNEADDTIATLAVGASKTKLIFTVDKDIMQVINPLVHIYTGKEIFDETKVKEKFGVYPRQIPDLLAITGDRADNIVGVKGYGPKKATAVLNQYGIIEHIPNHEDINKHRIKLLLNKRLTLLNKHAKIEELKFEATETISSLLDKYELKKIKEHINDYKVKEKQSVESFF